MGKLVTSCSRERTSEQQTKLNSQTGKLSETTSPPRWFPGSDKTTRRRARLWSISRSTWSSTPATSTCPCSPTLIGMMSYPGLASFFKKSSDEEREHGEKLIKYQNKRGGKVVFQDIAKPSAMEWGSPVDALEAALELEKTVNQSLLDMHKASDGDAHLCDFLEGEFLDEQVDAIKEISSLVTKWKRAGPGLGYHMLDKEIGN